MLRTMTILITLLIFSYQCYAQNNYQIESPKSLQKMRIILAIIQYIILFYPLQNTQKMMNTLRMSSRSISNDICFEKMKSSQMKIHRQRLQEIRNAPIMPHEKNTQRKIRLKQLSKSKSATHKVDQVFDPIKLQNKALINHIVEIKRRKLSLHDGTSLKNLHNYKSYKQEEEKKEIQKQNLRLINKIIEQKSKITIKKQLKQEIKQYESRREKLRKVHSKSNL